MTQHDKNKKGELSNFVITKNKSEPNYFYSKFNYELILYTDRNNNYLAIFREMLYKFSNATQEYE